MDREAHRSIPVATVAIGAAALLLAGALIAPGAGAAPVTCVTTSHDSAGSFGPSALSAGRTTVTVTVLSRSRTFAQVNPSGRRAWRAKVRMSTRLAGSAQRPVSAAVDASVDSVATAVCDGVSATASAQATVTGHAVDHPRTTDVRRLITTGVSKRKSRKAAVSTASLRALDRAKDRTEYWANRSVTTASSFAVESRAQQAGVEAAGLQARTEARAAAEAKARRHGGRPTPSTTPTNSATPTSSATPTNSSASPSSSPAPSTTSAVPTPTATATATVPSVARPLLIKHGWDIPSPSYVQGHVAAMERQPFDGLTIAMPGVSQKVQSQTPLGYDKVKQVLAPVAATRFTTLKHNFAMVYSAPAGDLFADWSVPLANFANVARAAKEAGFEGIFYDNEEYYGAAMDYPGNCSGHVVDECRAQAQLRGRQVMDAMRAQWPTVRLFTTFGPWISDPLTARNLPGVPWNDIAWANPLAGWYVAGMVASTVDTPAKVIDGGEMYTPRTAAQFQTVKAWQKQGMAAKSALVPASLRTAWAGTVSASFGIYDEPWIGVGMDAATWRTTIANALASTDEYVWAYTEKYDWWGSGWPSTPVPTAWVDATRAARSAP